MSGAQASWLPDGRRLHLHHGPIDLIVSAEGPERDAALAAAVQRFDGLLEDMVAELATLKAPVNTKRNATGPVAARMVQAVAPYDTFVTPMAAVAGAVADDILSAMTRHQLTKATVNNGGDIAFHLAPDETFRAASPSGPIEITYDDPARGLATSGWRGRSHSLGIADTVTTVARTAAMADVAATLIANAVDLPDHPAIARMPARDLSPDSDLGDRLVTTSVGNLSNRDVARALSRGEAFARDCLARGLIEAATLTLKGDTRLVTQDQKALSHA